MPLQSRHVKPLAMGTVVFLLVLIVVGTFYFVERQQSRFVDEIGDGAGMQEQRFATLDGADSLSASDFDGHMVVLHFWATWSERSQLSLERFADLAERHSSRMTIMAASVKDVEEYIDTYLEEQGLPDEVVHVEGTEVYQDMQIPGIPTYVIFDRNGELWHISVGFAGDELFEELEEHLRDTGANRQAGS